MARDAPTSCCLARVPIENMQLPHKMHSRPAAWLAPDANPIHAACCAKELAGEVAGAYGVDSIPWCGVFMALGAKRAGKEPPQHLIQALWSSTLDAKARAPVLGEVFVLVRSGVAHLDLYVGEDVSRFHMKERLKLLRPRRAVCLGFGRAGDANNANDRFAKKRIFRCKRFVTGEARHRCLNFAWLSGSPGPARHDFYHVVQQVPG